MDIANKDFPLLMSAIDSAWNNFQNWKARINQEREEHHNILAGLVAKIPVGALITVVDAQGAIVRGFFISYHAQECKIKIATTHGKVAIYSLDRLVKVGK